MVRNNFLGISILNNISKGKYNISESCNRLFSNFFKKKSIISKILGMSGHPSNTLSKLIQGPNCNCSLHECLTT